MRRPLFFGVCWGQSPALTQLMMSVVTSSRFVSFNIWWRPPVGCGGGQSPALTQLMMSFVTSS